MDIVTSDEHLLLLVVFAGYLHALCLIMEFSSPFQQTGLSYMANTTNSWKHRSVCEVQNPIKVRMNDRGGEKNQDWEGRERPV